MSSEFKKMVSGELYRPSDPELTEMRRQCRLTFEQYNKTSIDEPQKRKELLNKLFNSEVEAHIEPPFYCDYGSNIKLGKNVYMNFNCTILDVAPVEIGANTLFGPAVKICPATHPTNATLRNSGVELGYPVKIGKNCWLGANVTVCPGVTIGDNCVIGAGAVVVKDVPANSLVVGNPGRVIKKL